MPSSPLILAGAQITPGPTAPLHVNRMFSGLWTQGNPLRDRATPYLMEKFYSATRFDGLLGGSNIEINVELDLARRPGSSVYNAAVSSAIQRLYLFRTMVWNSSGLLISQNRLFGDTSSQILDVTGPSNNFSIFSKASGAGKTAMLGVGNTCYLGDGIDVSQFLDPFKIWIANTVYQLGDTIVDSNGHLEVVEGFLVANISTVAVIKKLTLPPHGYSFYLSIVFTSTPGWAIGTQITFAGLTAFTVLNGQTSSVLDPELWGGGGSILSLSLPSGVPATLYGPTADTGTGTVVGSGSPGQSGSVQPTWPGFGLTVTDGNLIWRNFRDFTYRWGAPGPISAPLLTAAGSNRQWQPSTSLNADFSILDPNNNIQVAFNANALTGRNQPAWNPNIPNAGASGGQTPDGSQIWQNCGPILAWLGLTTYFTFQCVSDSNGNLQIVTGGGGGKSGASAPSWATAVGATTTDGALTWTCVGPGSTILTAPVQYAFSFHYVSGHVTSASPIATLNPNGAILGLAGSAIAILAGSTNTDPGMDQIWIWRTPQGGSILELLVKIQNPNIGTLASWSFTDTLPDSVLNLFQQAPINGINNPPPTGFTPQAFHEGRIWGFVGMILTYSNGPVTLVGNGNESFLSTNTFQLPSLPLAAWASPIGLIVFRVDGLSVVLGSGISTDPFKLYNIFDAVGLGNRDGWSTRGNRIFLQTKTGKIISLTTSQIVAAVEGQLTQQLDDLEIGFPIGDLLTAQMSPLTTFVTWHEGTTKDSRLFVANTSGWFNLVAINQPEQCEPWSPFASFYPGISAIASIETAPGVQTLLIATPAGPIWQRDLTTSADSGTNFACSAIIGSIVLAQPGTNTAVEFITTEETVAGTPATVGALFDEISGTFIPLRNISRDPPNLPAPTSLNVQRFWASQDPKTAKICRHMQIQISWPAQNQPNELLTYTIFGRLPEKVRR